MKKVRGLSRKETLTDTDNSKVITRRKGDEEQIEKVKGGTNGDGRDLTLEGEYTIQYTRELCTWNLYNFIKQCHPNKFNKNK